MKNRLGYVYGIGAYLCWGVFPLFFMLLAEIAPLEIVPWRVMTALLFSVVVVTAIRAWRPVVNIFRSRRMLGWFIVSSLLLYLNWQIFVMGVVTGNIIEVSLGYFVNPIFTILIGVVVRKERLTQAQWWAVAISSTGVVISAIAYGRFPIYAIGVALSFGLYGAVRKQVSEDIDALTGLTVETAISSVIAIAQLALLLAVTGHLAAFDHGPAVTVPLLLSGLITAVPLLLFAAGTRRLPLSHMGFIQFMTPILSFLTGYFIFHEPMSEVRWIGFITVWVALSILIVDMLRQLRRHRVAGAEPPVVTGEIEVRPS